VRLWFAPSSEVPIYRQLVTQAVLAILSGDLRPGDKLPSTRELARRFAIHPNTVSAGYRQLERDGWTENRSGSGVYVRSNSEAPTTPQQILDQHIAGFFRAVRELNLPSAEIRARVAEWIAAPPPDHFLLIESDAELLRIFLTEIGQMTGFPARGVPLEECTEALAGAIPLCRPSKTKLVRGVLPQGVELITLHIRSAKGWLEPWLPAWGGSVEGRLIGVASHWPEFLVTAQTMLVAAGLDPDSLILRDARKRGWQRGLEQTAGIICDAYTVGVPGFPAKPRKMVFQLLADAARAELIRCVETASSL
jgi:DNA-binding transcriptional regulator YhcF (GntR family)